MLMARVKDDCRFKVITACSGREFVKYEFRQVPPGFEEEAKRNEFLEVADVSPKVEVEETPAEEVKAEDAVTEAEEISAEETPAEDAEPSKPRRRKAE